MALAMATKQQLWFQRGITELMKSDAPSITLCDNQAAIDIAYNPRLNDRTKHINIAYHFTRQHVECGTITVIHGRYR